MIKNKINERDWYKSMKVPYMYEFRFICYMSIYGPQHEKGGHSQKGNLQDCVYQSA